LNALLVCVGGSCISKQSDQDAVMKRVEYPDPSKFTQEQKAQFDRLPINLTRMLLHCPVPMVKSFLDLGLSFRAGNLDPKIRELVILRMGTLRGSSYELLHHLPAAKMAGLSEMEISAITSSKPSGLNEKLSLMLQLADECSQLGKVSDSTFEKLAKIFSAPEIAEATLLAGFYEMVGCFLETMGVKLDEHGLNWGKVDCESA
jgi:alkylhydroperoxidase family enzyme